MIERKYRSLGCWKDNSESRAISSVEGKGSFSDDSKLRIGPIEKCFDEAMRRGLDIFAIQWGGECYTDILARNKYKKYGPSSDCSSNGEGGPLANHVYEIENGKYYSDIKKSKYTI